VSYKQVIYIHIRSKSPSSDPWSTVSLAFFLRYPNPFTSHILSCDVISREFSSTGTLLTTRLLLKRGALPRWVPKGLVIRAESWVVEESEVDPEGKVLRCRTRNLDHVKIMQVHESHVIRPTADGYVHIVLFCAMCICIIDVQTFKQNHAKYGSSDSVRFWMGSYKTD